jgi:Flp pilus assembly protein TadD
MSAALHAAAAVALCAALHAMTGVLWRSFAASALFALHPLQAESVAWAAERSMVLAGLFFALTLLLWERHVRRPRLALYAAALCAFALALASKPIVVTLPLLLLLLDAWPLARLGPACGATPAFGFRDLAREKAPFFALAGAAGILALIAQQHGGAVQSLEAMPLGLRLANGALSFRGYLANLFWPSGLAVYYPPRLPPLPAGPVALSALLAVLLTGLACAQRRRRPWLFVGWSWFAIALLPTIGLVQVGTQAMADRYAYFPIAGASLAVVWQVSGTLRSRRPGSPLPILLAAAVLAPLGMATASQVRLWRDEVTLYTHALAVTSDNWMIEPALGNALAREERFAEALPHLQRAVRLSPGDPDVRYDLGNVLFRLGRLPEAEAAYREALRMRPSDADFQHNLGTTLVALGRLREAEAAYREALRLRPGNPVTHFLLGRVLALGGRSAEASARYREALRLQPDFAAAREELARLGRP